MKKTTYRIVNCDGNYATKEVYTNKDDTYTAIEELKTKFEYNNGYWLETK